MEAAPTWIHTCYKHDKSTYNKPFSSLICKTKFTNHENPAYHLCQVSTYLKDTESQIQDLQK